MMGRVNFIGIMARREVALGAKQEAVVNPWGAILQRFSPKKKVIRSMFICMVISGWDTTDRDGRSGNPWYTRTGIPAIPMVTVGLRSTMMDRGHINGRHTVVRRLLPLPVNGIGSTGQ